MHSRQNKVGGETMLSRPVMAVRIARAQSKGQIIYKLAGYTHKRLSATAGA